MLVELGNKSTLRLYYCIKENNKENIIIILYYYLFWFIIIILTTNIVCVIFHFKVVLPDFDPLIENTEHVMRNTLRF